MRFRRHCNPILLGIFLLVSCSSTATKQLTPVIGPYSDRLLTQEEVLSLSRIEHMKAMAEISLDIRGEHILDKASGVLYMQAPDKIRIRAYSLGLPVFDVLFKDGRIWSQPPGENAEDRNALTALVNSIRWWQDGQDASWVITNEAYVRETIGQTVWIDRQWLTPVRQIIRSIQPPVFIQYSGRVPAGDTRYLPERIEAQTSSYRLQVTISKVLLSVPLDPVLFEWSG